MSEKVSRIVVAIEAGLLLLPTSLLCIYGAVLLVTFGSPRTFAATQLIGQGLGLAALGCGWWLTLCYIRHGTTGLLAAPVYLWLLPALMCIAALAALWIVAESNGSADRYRLWLGQFVLGAPAIVPFLHLAAARALRSNNRMERPREP